MSNSMGSAEAQLRRGQERLAAANNNPSQLGSALQALHGAFEKRLRALLVLRLPEMSAEIRKMTWLDLANLASEQFGWSSSDRDLVLTANTHRNSYAHDDEFNWSRQGVTSYEALIRTLWVTGSRTGPSYGSGSTASTQASHGNDFFKPPPVDDAWETSRSSGSKTTSAPRTTSSTASATRTAPAPPRPAASRPSAPARSYSSPAGQRPWYRSTGFYWFAFVFLLPVWVVMILTDRRQGGLAKSFAMLVVLCYGGACFYLIAMFQMLDFPTLSGAPTPARVSTAVPARNAPPPGNPDPSGQEAGEEAAPAPPGGCALVWAAYPGEELVNKNRSMVWNEIVSQQVRGSGMEARDFYQAVVDHNPTLADDGYEFKRGKTYLLPRCE